MPAASRCGMRMLLGLAAQDLVRQPGRDHVGHRQRDDHPHRGVDRDRAHVRPHQPGHEGHRQQGRDHGEGREDGRSADLVHRERDGLEEFPAALGHVPVDVLHHHDGIVHQDPDGEDQREQRHAVEREAIGPGSEQRDRQRDHHGHTDDEGLAPAQRDPDQDDHRGGREDQLLDQGVRLVVGGHPVVAGDGRLDAVGDIGPAQLIQALDQGVGDIRGIGPRLLGNRHGDRRVALARARSIAGGRAMGKAHVLGGIGRPLHHLGHVLQVDRTAVVHPDHQPGKGLGLGNEVAGLDQDLLVVLVELPGVAREIGGLQAGAQIIHRQVVGGQRLRLEAHVHHVIRPADCVDITGTRDALELGLDPVRDAQQIVPATLGVLGPQGHVDDRHIVNAHRLDDRFADPQPRRQPVLVGEHLVVQAHQCRGAVLADLELDGDLRHVRARGGVDIVDALDLREHLLGRRGDQLRHLLRARPGERDEHVGHGHVDLRLFLARGYQDREQPQQQAQQGQQRRDLGRQKGLGNAPGDPHALGRPLRGAIAHGFTC